MRYSSLNALDRALIDSIAEYWVSEGGDSAGFLFCSDAIKERIDEICLEHKGVDAVELAEK